MVVFSAESSEVHFFSSHPKRLLVVPGDCFNVRWTSEKKEQAAVRYNDAVVARRHLKTKCWGSAFVNIFWVVSENRLPQIMMDDFSLGPQFLIYPCEIPFGRWSQVTAFHRLGIRSTDMKQNPWLGTMSWQEFFIRCICSCCQNSFVKVLKHQTVSVYSFAESLIRKPTIAVAAARRWVLSEHLPTGSLAWCKACIFHITLMGL